MGRELPRCRVQHRAQFRQVRAFSDFEGDVVAYRMRYRCGTEIIGPFSQSYRLVLRARRRTEFVWLSH